MNFNAFDVLLSRTNKRRSCPCCGIKVGGKLFVGSLMHIGTVMVVVV